MKMLDELKTERDGRPISYISGRSDWIEVHHVYPGPNRKLSEKYGLCVYLTHDEHNEPPQGVHFNRENANRLQREVQKAAMKHYNWTEEDFRRIFGRSYL